MGYMASGKSSVGKALATNLSIDFIDLDDYIETAEELTISQIFDQKGEIYFRLKETEYLEEVLNLNKNFILSVGGGTPCYGKNSELILEKSTSVYLMAKITTLFNRLKKEKLKRPLIASLSEEKMQEFIAKHLFERRNFYEKATFSIDTDEKLVHEIADEIQQKLV